MLGIVLGIVGIITTLVIYFSGSNDTNTISTHINVILPTVSITALYLLYFLFTKATPFINKTREVFRYYNETFGTECNTNSTIRIENNVGDVIYSREIEYKAIRNNINFNETSTYSISSTSKNIPPNIDTSLISTNISALELKLKMRTETKHEIEGKTLYQRKWSYTLSAPLRNKGDNVKFRYQLPISGSEKSAFTESGSAVSIQCSVCYATSRLVLISPKGYKIEILKCYFENFDGIQSEVSNLSMPELDPNNEILTWSPEYKKSGHYICKYRLVIH
ncbi:hypothetical protein [Vibrio parahaemolyticus]|uniref:hypothetical protein n=1 Tax=Vibrio parahaemolyticus TaxID=670 RepID=UPI000C7A3084|nr:hypothetical protein [Vibrio parahaemolyticus]PLR59089.1 hypothetical protein CYU11_03280 [Vibrio parahaemolyticus]